MHAAGPRRSWAHQDYQAGEIVNYSYACDTTHPLFLPRTPVYAALVGFSIPTSARRLAESIPRIGVVGPYAQGSCRIAWPATPLSRIRPKKNHLLHPSSGYRLPCANRSLCDARTGVRFVSEAGRSVNVMSMAGLVCCLMLFSGRLESGLRASPKPPKCGTKFATAEKCQTLSLAWRRLAEPRSDMVGP